ncbi:MAG: hypothetical protein PVJ39_19895 [Gammaproteobacteria bacterium]|jgi:hypothetical protein
MIRKIAPMIAIDLYIIFLTLAGNASAWGVSNKDAISMIISVE